MVFGEMDGVERDGWCLERWVVLRERWVVFGEMGGVERDEWCLERWVVLEDRWY